ncbi:MAG: ABC transporter ATP-binding protein [Desulfuromonadales bacterium]|nr:MAG: ABC transporter ATP-binding protein [Desulfuromonadales bacterium]
MNIAVKVEGVSKKYCRTLKHTMIYGITDLAAGFLGLDQQAKQLRSGEFWAVEDVTFSVQKGETIGIIGTNGSGKSTLLKMLNGIFMPDRGRIEISGKTGALIEVGAGFHPMLTGRENIYINAAIYGMSKTDTDRKFSEIVDFAGVGDFLDAPVKHYSSGMYVRLGFAIAINCNPDILLIDEVLAVGDLSFKLKCIERIKDLQRQGNTIFYVAHDLISVKKLCTRAVWLNNGSIALMGESNDVVDACDDFLRSRYYCDSHASVTKSETLVIDKVTIEDIEGNERAEFNYGETVFVRVRYHITAPLGSIVFGISLTTCDQICVSALHTGLDGIFLDPQLGVNEVLVEYPNVRLLSGTYLFDIGFFESTALTPFCYRGMAATIKITSPFLGDGLMVMEHKWHARSL